MGGLATRSGARPTQLSGGERQRVAIAPALAGHPDIVLADEPTGNFDQATGLSTLALLEALHDTGVTILIITHDQGIAPRMPRPIETLDHRDIAATVPAAFPPHPSLPPPSP